MDNHADNKASDNVTDRYRSLILIWSGLVVSQLMFVIVIYFVSPQLFTGNMLQADAGDSSPITIAALMVCLGTWITGSILKKRNYAAAAALNEPNRIQAGLIVGCAFAEVSSIIGIFFAMALDYQHFFIFNAIGVLGTLLHFPSRSAIDAAFFKRSF